MSDIEMRTFKGVTISPKEDALIYQTAITKSGLFYGGDVTYTGGNTLNIASAEGVICGRKFTIEECAVSAVLPQSGTLRGQVIIHADLGNVDDPIQFIVETAENPRELRQDEDFNIRNGVYEIQLCTFTASASRLSNIEKTILEGFNNLAPSGGGGIAPNPMISISASPGNTKVNLIFTPPDDTVIEGQYLCYVGGLKCVRKTGSAPEHETDGTLLFDLKGDDIHLYETTPYEDADLENGTEYYYRFFPYSTLGIVNTSSTGNVVSATPQPYVLYGFRIDKNDSNPDTRVTYTDMAVGFTPARMNFSAGEFEYGSWNPDNIFFLRHNLPYMVKSDGKPDYQLDPSDLSKKLDGTASDIANTAYDGNAMARFGTVWLYQYEDSNYQYCKICNIKLNDNYKAYAHQREDGSIMDYIWLSIYPSSLISNKARSLSGQTLMNNQTGTNELTYSKANGALWSTRSWAHRNLVNMLLILMGKSTNTQAVFGNGHTTGGSAAGHLYRTGVINDTGRFYGTSGEGSVRVFFLDQWWGDQWERIEGCVTNASGNILTKMVKPYNATGAGYTDSGVKPAGTSGGYQSADVMTMNGLIPKTASGSQTTYTADGLWYANSCYAIVGGDCTYGALDGAFCLSVSNAVSYANWDVGAALSCEQPVAA